MFVLKSLVYSIVKMLKGVGDLITQNDNYERKDNYN